MHEVELVERPSRRVIGLPHRGAYNRIGPVFEQLAAALTERELWPEAVEFLGIYYDDPESVEERDLRSMAGIAVRDDLGLPAGLEQVRLPAGRYAVLHHRGPYSGLPDAWTWLHGEWLPKSGLAQRDGPAAEIYRNSPGQVAEAELLTDICLAIA